MNLKVFIIPVFLLFGSSALFSQITDDSDAVMVKRELAGFTGIEAGGIASLFIESSEDYIVGIEADNSLHEKVITTLRDDVLVISTNRLRSPSRINVYVGLPELKYLKASGATDVSGKTVLSGEELKIYGSGATTITLEIDVNYLESYISGAADLLLSGKAHTHFFDISGAGSLKAKELESVKAVYSLSGASVASVRVTDDITGTKKGSSKIINYGDAKIASTTGSETEKTVFSGSTDKQPQRYRDSAQVSIGRIVIDIYDSDDSVRVRVGDRELHIDDDGNVRYKKHKKAKFNGHWAGFEMGLNGYVNPDFNMSFPREYEYLDLRMAKSVVVNLNFFEQNVALAKNQKLGMVTGLGLSWNNYRLSRHARLEPDSSELVGYLDQGINIRKSKLTTLYLNIPLLLEFQTKNQRGKNRFHFGAGMIAGTRLSSHTKKYYDELNKPFSVALYDAGEDQYQVEYTSTSPGNPKTKRFDDFHLRPFKFDATARIGWGFINLFATYSVNQMFKKDKGPELYPWSVGITLVNF
jgi:hypothetical protein